MWSQNQNFEDPHGCLGGKYKPFGKISFLAWKKPFRARIEKKLKIHFFTFLNKDWNTPQKNLVKKLYMTLWENCFRVKF